MRCSFIHVWHATTPKNSLEAKPQDQQGHIQNPSKSTVYSLRRSPYFYNNRKTTHCRCLFHHQIPEGFLTNRKEDLLNFPNEVRLPLFTLLSLSAICHLMAWHSSDSDSTIHFAAFESWMNDGNGKTNSMCACVGCSVLLSIHSCTYLRYLYKVHSNFEFYLYK